MVITVEVYKDIRKMRLDGMSQRKIAKKLHISRHTVKKYWDGDHVPWERKDYIRSASVLTEDITGFVQKCLDEDEKSHSRKQHHTARRIYHRLVDECGFTGAESTIRRLVRQMRNKATEPFIPLAYPAGDAMQVDWGDATVYLDGVKTVIYLFCARLCYSEAPIVFAYRRQNEESFLDAFVRAFTYFGGVPKRVIFDNAKVAVKGGFGAHAIKQAGYAALSAHYSFDAIFCNPASGNEKGLVEGLVGYIRRNVCVPIPKVKDIEELNQRLSDKCEKYLGHQIRGKKASVGEMLKEEQCKFQPLPGYAFDPCKRSESRVDRFCTVRFNTNNYSVPYTYCGKKVAIKAGPETIDIFYDGKNIASHRRCYEWKQSIYSLEHYLPILAKKGRAILYARPVRDNLPASFIDWLGKQKLSPKELVELLYQCLEKDCETVMMEANHHQAPSLIEDRVFVEPVDLHAYDVFLNGKAGTAV